MNASLEPPSFGRRRKTKEEIRAADGSSRRARLLAWWRESRRRRLVVLAAAGLVLVAVGTGYALTRGGDSPAGEAPSATSSATPESDRPPVVTKRDLKGVSEDAEEVLLAWARPDLGYDAWWSGLAPLLSPGARTDYASTDPASLPELTLGEGVEIRPGPSKDTATVFFETTGGRFGVDMSRQGARAPWRMVRILFPGQESSLR